MKRSIFLILLTALAAAGLYYVVFHHPSAESSSEVPSLVFAAPQDARYLVYVDVAALRKSPFVTRLRAQVPAPEQDSEYAEFVRATDFDYSRDLERVVITFRGEASNLSTFAVAEGKFNRRKIEKYAAAQGHKEYQNGSDVYIVPTNARSKSVSFAFLPDANGVQRAALAEGSGLGSALQRGSDPPPPGTQAALMRERIQRGAGAAFFAVVPTGDLTADLGSHGVASPEVAEILRGVRWIIVTAQPEGDRLRIAIEGECDGMADALRLSTMLSGLKMLVGPWLNEARAHNELRPEQRAVVEAILERGEIRRDGKSVQWSFELGPEFLSALHSGARGLSR